VPGSGGELFDDDQVIDYGCDVDDDAERDQGYSCDDGVGGGGLGGGVLGGGELAEEETEAADGEANTHEAEARADPSEEGALGGEVDAGVLLGRVGHEGIVAGVREDASVGVLGELFAARRADSRFPDGMTERQEQEKKQIPGGNDRKKSKSKSKSRFPEGMTERKARATTDAARAPV
jgi:hypothetical protein